MAATNDTTGTVPISYPASMAEVETLVRQLYQPGSPQKVAQVQEILQQLQRSPEGWQLANDLFNSSDDKVKFFAALTFTVKLNSDSDNLGEADARLVLERLVGWLIHCQRNNCSQLVIRKLCSTLVVYFMHFSSTWTKCIRHLLGCLKTDQYLSQEALNQAPPTSVMLEGLDPGKLTVGLWFATSLVEEIGKTDSSNIKHHRFHEILLGSVDDVVAMLALGLGSGSGAAVVEQKVRQDCMKCFQSWVFYSHRAFIDAAIVLDPLKTLTKPAMACLVDDNMYESTVELFSDVLANYSSFLAEDDLQMLFHLLGSSWSRGKYSQLVQGDFDFDSLQFGHFMLAFGDATVQNLVRQSGDTETQDFLAGLTGLLAAQGYAIAEDKIFVPALEFWATFVEEVIDSLYTDEGERAPWIPIARSHVVRAIENCWRKIQFPPTQEFATWDSVDKTSLHDARKDFADILQSSYTLIGSQLLTIFVQLALQALQTESYAELEASLYCLSALADCVPDESDYDTIMSQLFGSNLFDALVATQGNDIPQCQTSATRLIGHYDSYFERHGEYLPGALTFLFKSLTIPTLGVAAAKSIHSLCSSCRRALVPEVEAFLQQYDHFAQTPSADGLVKEKVLGAIACIVQAIDDDQAKIQPIMKLLGCVDIDIHQCMQLASIGHEDAENAGLTSLRCLTSIAKGLQAPSNMPLDLEQETNRSQFWITGPGSATQAKILDMIRKTMQILSRNGEVVEAACAVFRAGFTEKEPNAFVFATRVVVEFIVHAEFNTPRLGSVICTACSLISSSAMDPKNNVDDLLQSLLAWISGLLQTLSDPANDPEIAQHGIDGLCRLMNHHIRLFIESQPFSSAEHIFMFTLKALTGRDPLPKASAAEFWASFVSQVSNPEPIQASINAAMEQLGPLLAEALVYNIGGNAARSELDRVSEPLKKLVVRQVRAKTWLSSALRSLQNERISDSEKNVFLQRLMNLRGARGTNGAVKDFWMLARGTSFAYAS